MRKLFSLILGLALILGLLAGCRKQEPILAPEQIVIKNDGRAASIALGTLEGDGYAAALEEIAAKYMADYPNTQISVRTFEGAGELEAALRAGEIDIAELDQATLPAHVRDGLLYDFNDWIGGWEEFSTLSPAAKFALRSMGQESAYLFPADTHQDILYYRADWFEEYNAGKASSDMVYCRTWDQIVKGAAEQLGQRGKLALAGEDRLADYFDDMLWSYLTLGRIREPEAAYFYPSVQPATVFFQEKSDKAAEQFLEVMRVAVLPEALHYSTEEAVQAFLEGRAGLLLADRSAAEALNASMPEGSWAAREFPLERTSLSVTSLNSFRGWGISAGSPEKEIAFHFLSFLSGSDNNTHLAVTFGSLPVHTTSVYLEPDLSESAGAVELSMFREPDSFQYASEPVSSPAYEGYREQINEKLRDYIAGELSQEELLTWLDQYWAEE